VVGLINPRRRKGGVRIQHTSVCPPPRWPLTPPPSRGQRRPPSP
jgi:hypothetical protein